MGTSGLHTDSDGFLLVDQHMRPLVTKNAWKFRSGVLVFLQKNGCTKLVVFATRQDKMFLKLNFSSLVTMMMGGMCIHRFLEFIEGLG